MKHSFWFWKRKNAEQHHFRRIYKGDVPLLQDSNTDLLKQQNKSKSELQRASKQTRQSVASHQSSSRSHHSKSPPPEEQKPTSVRRHSVQPPSPGHSKTNLQKQAAPEIFPSNLITTSRYTLWNFLPKNLFEQFRRVVNFYFLVIAFVQSVIDTPVHPITAVSPLCFVIFVTAVKQGYEDWLRHKSDDQVNNRVVRVVRDGKLIEIKSKDILVGDIIKLEVDEPIPTDMLLLGSSDEFSRCQINTANLDGETNLKLRYCPSGLPPFKNPEDFEHLHIIVECEHPNEDLYEFNGSLLIPAEKLQQMHWHPPEASSNTDEDSVASTATNKDQKPDILADLMHGIVRQGMTDFLSIPLSMENMTLRGTRLKNTEYIYGFAVYTGKDTRLAKNSEKSESKFSTVEKTVNYYLAFFVAMLVVIVIFCSMMYFFYDWGENGTPWYRRDDKGDEKKDAERLFNTVASFIILYNYIIPISLYVTIELQKFLGSKFFVWDNDMIDEAGNEPLCNTSDLNEELGLIEYLFSDKTGTLTQNLMKFTHCSIQGIKYEMKQDTQQLYRIASGHEDEKLINVFSAPDVLYFIKTLALCHSVQVVPKRRPSFEMDPKAVSNVISELRKKKDKDQEKKEKKEKEQEKKEKKDQKKEEQKQKKEEQLQKKEEKREKRDSKASKLRRDSKKENPELRNRRESLRTPQPQSAPNLALVEGMEYQASSPDEKALLESCESLGVVFLGDKDDYLTIGVGSTSERYRRLMMLEFDADRKCMSVIVENSKNEIWLLTKGAESSIIPKCDNGPTHETLKHVTEYALTGLRTLAVAVRKLSRQEFDEFNANLRAARRVIKNRQEKVREVYMSIENNLTLLGATGVEDQLQDNVRETLQSFAAAGIRVWMLTGDKLETGVNVALSCGLLTASTKQYIVSHISEQAEVKRRLQEIRDEMDESDNTSFIIDGESLGWAFRECPDLLQQVSMAAYRVVCCRMAPLQKAQVVNMVKNSKSKPTCAAVGDGANDCAMILAANIGIGILGKEGRQAARCADFALAKFCHLRKAILVHGHWYYVRIANLANYFFYKNVVFIMPQFFFSFHSNFSTQALFNGLFLMNFNIFFSSCPIFFYGLTEQPYPADVLLRYPQLYKKNARNSLMTVKVFTPWFLAAIWHSAVCYYAPFFAWGNFDDMNDLPTYGTIVFSGIVLLTNLKMFVETKLISLWYVGAHLFSYVTYLVITLVFSEMPQSVFNAEDYRHVFLNVLSSLCFWLVIFLVGVVGILPDITFAVLKRSWKKIVRHFQSFGQIEDGSIGSLHHDENQK